MKKIIAILLVLCMVFAFAGCGAAGNDESKESSAPASTPAVDLDELDEDEEEVKKEFPTLSGEEEYVVARKKGTKHEVKDITEIANYKVGLVRNSDSELIGLYYCDEENVHIHGTDHDAFSDLTGGGVEIVICRKSAANAKDNLEIILDPIEMIELP